MHRAQRRADQAVHRADRAAGHRLHDHDVHHDEIATPPAASFVHEPGVRNEYVQDTCPRDPVGHLGEPYDANVGQLVENALDPADATPPIPCVAGLPI
ncbi:hypothetical protein [Amycolatopsis sp. H20-H5]|uniref:hypothetical protein n=1 Tax=Amycolatopsis sp. H20-H5 TaxID=3046309 RepID=UPI002DB64555|nr:hypothetical protein [Amycolatopsis sp. H20-H5]MEC3977588.1 hypothetical protein [Amycolatopsis sp. H20-H5]